MQSTSQKFELPQLGEPPSKSVLDRSLWPLLLMLAWLAFELTANATLSLVLACVNFGVNDFRTAWWLWRNDPQRSRARACGAFYLASGVWKTAMVPLLVAGTIAILWAMFSPNAMQPNHPGTKQLENALMVGSFAAALLILLVLVATILALAARWRVWVHPSIHASRKRGAWPPGFVAANKHDANQAKLVVITGVFALVLVGPVISLSLISHLPLPRKVLTVLNLCVVFGFPIFTVLSLSFLRTRLFADSPWECWPESIRWLTPAGQLESEIEEAAPADSS